MRKSNSQALKRRFHRLAVGVCGGLMLGASVPTAHAATPTYADDVARILDRNCVQCHRQDGSAAGIPLDSYEAVKLKVNEVRDKVGSGAMPPWPADPAQSLPMKNDPRMTPEDIGKLLDWVQGGAPRGGNAGPSPPTVCTGGWHHPDGRPPDWIVSLPKFTIRPNGTIP